MRAVRGGRAAYARREYGVVIDERTWKVVPEETARLRAAAQPAR